MGSNLCRCGLWIPRATRQTSFPAIVPVPHCTGRRSKSPRACGRTSTQCSSPGQTRTAPSTLALTSRLTGGRTSLPRVRFGVNVGEESSTLIVLGAILGFVGAGALLFKMTGNEKPSENQPNRPLEEDKDELLEERTTRPPKKERPELKAAESLGDNPELQHNVEELIQAAAKHKDPPTTKSIFSAVLEKVLMDSIKKIVKSNQTDKVQEYMTVKEDGKTSWVKTHFVFALDCSGSMRGSRWDSVTIGYESFLKRVKDMQSITISSFSFDTKVNAFCKERSVEWALEHVSEIPFTAKGTNYKRALEYTIKLIEETAHQDYLVCIMFLSDGLSAYPDAAVKQLQLMRDNGKKILFYTCLLYTSDAADE
eukprot:TRINITY_DN6906_c0_g1_i3.p1 TRINITY_DN6906_c0_g1~~TRINITY_DN6906_c0_g1_i3.p1  ORF type:complete len:367 (+),score=106.13 TRINITY_DN6906_c0_g1_i3:478-1578(+)